MERYLWIIPFAPLLGAIVNGKLAALYARREKGSPEWVVSLVGCAAPILSFLVAAVLFVQMRAAPASERLFTQTLYTWIAAGPVHVDFAFMVDALAMVMVLVVTGVGSIIHVYSVGYMHGDRGYARYFAYLNLFMFSMLMLVMAKSLPLLFVGWEGVGLCSYLLIGFWYRDMAKAAAGKKAFIVNRVGDFAFLLGMFLIFVTTMRVGHPTLDVPELRALVGEHPQVFGGIATAACLLLFVGATGKSAQIPLYVWLPDAMAGPTPVSALIHAATMVTAGVYMIARMSFLYDLAPAAMAVVATIGAATAIFAASIGFAQRDIKRVLAYSTVSQLGYMFMAVGVGAYGAGIFHLMTHAFFKACLFLGSGSVIHAMSGEQDMFRMGGLAKTMKVTAATFLIASLAIAGVPPLAGFVSKDEILWMTFSSPIEPSWLPYLLWAVAFVAAGMTAFYVFRAVFLTFYGEDRVSPEAKHHLHESPAMMTVPLVLLAAGSVLAGFLGWPAALRGGNWFHSWLAPVFGGHDAGHGGEHALADVAGPVAASAGGHDATVEYALMALSVAIGLAGIFMAYRLYIKNPALPARITARLGRFYRMVFNKYYVDEVYEHTIVRPGYGLSDKVMFRFVDMGIIEGIVNGLGITARLAGATVRLFQSGVIRTYAFFLLLGFVLIVWRMVR
jgi:NADH-quinone oxidoreductase subunit L